MHQPTDLHTLPDFVARHIGPSAQDQCRMLDVVGQPSLEALVDTALPSRIRSQDPLHLSAAASEPSPSCGRWRTATRCLAR